MAGSLLRLRVEGMPEVISALRRELAAIILRHAADSDNPEVERELVEIAAEFEAGQ